MSFFDLDNIRLAPEVRYPEVKFYLFTRQNWNYGQQLEPHNRTSFIRSDFNCKWPVRIFVHGWRGGVRSCAGADIKNAYLKRNQFNVIIMDWSDWAHSDLETASESVRVVGKKLAHFTKYLNREWGVPYKHIYLIGHSLGAHVAGRAGALIHPQQFETIFALDPAGPYFEGTKAGNRLDPSDAKYVEAIVTDGNRAGYRLPEIGHASIYVNFGRPYQPGCREDRLLDPMCNHRMAIKYFVDSIRHRDKYCAVRTKWRSLRRLERSRSRKYKSKKLRGSYVMGGEPSEEKHGLFLVTT